MITTDTNKTIVTKLIDGLFTRGDLDVVYEYLSDDFVDHDPPFGVSADREGFRAAGAICRAAFPDWSSEVHLLIAEGDYVAEHFTASGTHQGEMFGIGATGRKVSLNGVNIFRLRAARVTDRWGRHDVLSFLQDLGVAPTELA